LSPNANGKASQLNTYFNFSGQNGFRQIWINSRGS
jgi:hypothetical protein